jgi:hypothetical protein
VPANAALVKGGAAHDSGEPYSLGQAWRAGFSRFWPTGSYGLSALAGVLGAIVLLAAIPFWIVFAVVVALAIRAAVLDGRSPSAASADGVGLVRRRVGRVALMYVLIGIAGIVAGLPWLAVVVAVCGGVSAFTSTCWTLGYTRFDLESQPAGRMAPAAV